MKVFLMYRDKNFDLNQKLPFNEQALTQDLELNTLFNAMSLNDKFLFEVARTSILTGLNNDIDTIIYRQNILKDCLKNPDIIKDIYNISLDAIESEKKIYWGIFGKYIPAILDRAIELLHIFVEFLKRLRKISSENIDKFESEGFRNLFSMLNEELNDDYFAIIQSHLTELEFRNGVLISAELGKGNKGTNYILRKPRNKKRSWKQKLFGTEKHTYTFTISDRDEAGARALSELKNRGINSVANALAQSADHILSFFTILRTELAFYIGCLNLYEQLNKIGEPTSFPLPVSSDKRLLSFKSLYDVCLSLTMQQKIVSNDINADNKNLVIITGANQGGKSTFLRSIGLSQLMMQCGMFVPAESFCANICDGLFTHYKREEDITMKSGKLDEELNRMSDIVDKLTPDSILLLNESFSATNEREGSEIARQIICALSEKRIKTFFVTHLYEFAHKIYNKKMTEAIFLRAERQADGTRTFKLIEGEPLQTSYGKDLYERIFEI